MAIWIHDVFLVAISLVNDNHGSAMYRSTTMLRVSYILSMGMPTSVMIKYCTAIFPCVLTGLQPVCSLFQYPSGKVFQLSNFLTSYFGGHSVIQHFVTTAYTVYSLTP
jgi:hypothetical protein